mgnify:CR=1 FL=1
MDFGEFFDIQYDTDSEGEVYPDVYTEFEKGAPSDKKKKGKGVMPSEQPKSPTK